MALADNTPIPIPQGWTLAKNLKVGDYVISWKGKPTKIMSLQTYQPQEMYEVTLNDGLSFKADKHTKLPVETTFDRQNEALLKHVRPRRKKQRYATINQMMETGLYTKRMRKFYAVPNSQPIEFLIEDHPVPPFIVGMWMTNRNKTNVYTIPEERLDYVKKEIKLVGWSHKMLKNGRLEIRPSIATSFLTRYFSIPTDLPIEYTFGSMDQRIDLLRGLLALRPNCYDEKTHRFRIQSDDLKTLQTLQGICESLGIKTNAYSRETCFSHVLTFKTNIKLVPNQVYVKRMPAATRRMVAKIETIPTKECIHIETEEPFVVGQGFLPVWH